MEKKYKWILAIIAVVGWSVIGYFVWSYLQKPKKTTKIYGQAEYDTLVQPTHYKKIPLKSFKYLVVKCDVGPIKVTIEADDNPAIQFHQTFMKYTEMEYKGDTLVIHTLKSPQSTKENPIYKQIYIYTPDIKYYQAEATQTFFSYLKIDQLKVDNRSSYMRFHSCSIDKLHLTTNKSCNFVLDNDTFFGRIRAEINPNSAFTCLGYVEKELILKSKDFTNITIGEGLFKKVKVEKW